MSCLGDKVGHSEQYMVRDTAPSHDVLPRQVWWSCVKWYMLQTNFFFHVL